MKVKEGFFWDSYIYSFKEEEATPDEPKNLCRYFWRGVHGTILRGRDTVSNWFGRLSVLRSLLYSVALIGLSAGFIYTLERLDLLPPAEEGPPWWFLPNMGVMMTGILFFFVAGGKIVCRICKKVASVIGEGKLEIIGGVIVGLLLLAAVVFALLSPVEGMTESFVRMVIFMGILFGSMVGISLLMVLGVLLHTVLLNWRATADFMKTTVQYLKAAKNKVCPVIEAPDSFQRIKESNVSH